MRTITHIGVPTTRNFTITAPVYYSFVFDPNILSVEVATGYYDTQEVTITCNGITQKRNCVGYKCNFDLSAIFRSFFANSDFKLNYTAVSDDPFFQEEFNIAIKVGYDTENVPFTLRWGCHQFDEPATPTVINFPFFVGYPLVINSQLEHDQLQVEHYAIINYINDVKTYNPSFTVNFVAKYKASGVTVQTINYLASNCRSGSYLEWVDSRGQVWHYLFKNEAEKSIKTTITTDNETIKYPTSITDSYNGRLQINSKSKQRSRMCYASVSEDIYTIIESIASSPIVTLWDNNYKWIGVKVSDMSVQATTDWTIDIEFEIQLPKDFIQKR